MMAKNSLFFISFLSFVLFVANTVYGHHSGGGSYGGFHGSYHGSHHHGGQWRYHYYQTVYRTVYSAPVNTAAAQNFSTVTISEFETSIIPKISLAKKSVDLVVGVISLKKLSQELETAQKRGVKVRIISVANSPYGSLSDVNTRYSKNAGSTQDEFAIVDSAEVLTGLPWVYRFPMISSEAIKKYQDEFDSLWSSAGLIPIKISPVLEFKPVKKTLHFGFIDYSGLNFGSDNVLLGFTLTTEKICDEHGYTYVSDNKSDFEYWVIAKVEKVYTKGKEDTSAMDVSVELLNPQRYVVWSRTRRLAKRSAYDSNVKLIFHTFSDLFGEALGGKPKNSIENPEPPPSYRGELSPVDRMVHYAVIAHTGILKDNPKGVQEVKGLLDKMFADKKYKVASFALLDNINAMEYGEEYSFYVTIDNRYDDIDSKYDPTAAGVTISVDDQRVHDPNKGPVWEETIRIAPFKSYDENKKEILKTIENIMTGILASEDSSQSAAYAKAAQTQFDNGKAAYSHGNFAKAMEDYQKAIEANPGFADAYYNLALADYGAKEYDSAWDNAQRAKDLGGKVDPAFVDKIKEYIPERMSRVSVSAKDYDIVHKYLNDADHTYWRDKNYKQAVISYGKVIALAPKFIDGYVGRAFAYEKLEQYQKAIADYNTLINIYPRFDTGYFYRGRCYSAFGKYKNAIADFDTIINNYPEECGRDGSYGFRGGAYAKLGQYQRAIADFDKELVSDPNSSSTYAERAAAYFEIKKYDNAWADIHKAQELYVKVDPEFIEKLKKASGREK